MNKLIVPGGIDYKLELFHYIKKIFLTVQKEKIQLDQETMNMKLKLNKLKEENEK